MSIIRTYSRKQLDLLNPQHDQIDIADIAVGLSRVCRWANMCRKFYSVAEHSIVCYEIGLQKGYEAHHLMALLLHDAPEYVLYDMCTQAKALMTDYKIVEARLKLAIAEKFRLDLGFISGPGKVIDLEVMELERSYVHRWPDEPEFRSELYTTFKCYQPEIAENKFLEYFHKLNNARNKNG